MTESLTMPGRVVACRTLVVHTGQMQATGERDAQDQPLYRPELRTIDVGEEVDAALLKSDLAAFLAEEVVALPGSPAAQAAVAIGRRERERAGP